MNDVLGLDGPPADGTQEDLEVLPAAQPSIPLERRHEP